MKHLGFFDILFTALFIALASLYFIDPNFLAEFRKVIAFIPITIGGIIFIWAALQLQSMFSPFPSPIEKTKLITGGIYKYIRHPMYSGLMFLAIGGSIYASSFDKLMIALVSMVYFGFLAGYEERKLNDKFPAYSDYAIKTGKFLPAFLRFKVTREKTAKQQPQAVEMIEENIEEAEGKEGAVG